MTKNSFITHLEKVCGKHTNPENRAVLAKLRRGLGKKLGDTQMYPYVLFYLQNKPKSEHHLYFLVASLFGFYSETTEQEVSMGTVYKQLKQAFNEADSIDKRFVALLNAHEDELIFHLRQAVSLAKSKNIPLNYHRLLPDILQWSHPERRTQYKWAKDYWQTATQPNQEESDDNTI